MSDELVFYTNPMSRGRIVRWMLEEVGQPYRTELLDYGTTIKAPEYLAINPMGKVPALRHGDAVVTECAAICCYLADAFPDAGLAPPPGDRLRGPYYRWMFFAAGPLEAAATNKAFGFEVPAERKAMVGLRQPRRRDVGARGCALRARVSRRRSLHRRRPLRRLSHRLGDELRHDREAPGVRALLRADQHATGRHPGARDRRRPRCGQPATGVRIGSRPVLLTTAPCGLFAATSGPRTMTSRFDPGSAGDTSSRSEAPGVQTMGSGRRRRAPESA